MTAAEFEAYVKGKTLTFGFAGDTPYGLERYHAGRRVTWTFLDGQCTAGFWYETDPGTICFEYEDNPVPQCWQFRIEGEALAATFVNDGTSLDLYEADFGGELICDNFGV